MGRERRVFWAAAVCVGAVSCLQGTILRMDAPASQLIPAQGWMPPAELSVGPQIHIDDLNVKVDLVHSEISDLRIVLESPWGETVVLKNEWVPPWREKFANLTDTVFDDQADMYLKEGAPPYAGVFRPVKGESLAAFNDQDAQGVWLLRILDAHPYDAGRLNYWELHITHMPEPTSLLFLLLALPFWFLKRKSVAD